MALATVSPETPIESAVYNLHVGAHSGTAGAGQPLVCTDIGSATWLTNNAGVDPDTLWAGTFRNQGDDGNALRALSGDGLSTLFSVANAGVTIGGFASGSAAAPSIAFVGDTNTGIYRIGADEAALVAGANEAIRWRLGSKFAQVGIGDLDGGAWSWTGGNNVVLHVHTSTSVASDGDIIAGHFELTNNASSGGAGAVPDSSAISAVMYQTASTADGSIRAIEGHAIRAHASAGANANSTAMGMELGIHSMAAGNASFPNGAGAAPKNILGYLPSNDASPATSCVRADVGWYFLGAAGYKSVLHWVDTDGVTVLFDVGLNNGTIRTGKAGNAAAPQWTFFDDADTGVFWGGTNVLALSAGGVEFARGGNQAFQITTAEVLAGVISPTQLAANTDNWNPTGLGTARIIRVTTDASRNLTGIIALAPGTVLAICNAGAQNLVLVHSATSTAANQFILPNSANLTLLPGMSVEIFYDTASTKWRCLNGFVS